MFKEIEKKINTDAFDTEFYTELEKLIRYFNKAHMAGTLTRDEIEEAFQYTYEKLLSNKTIDKYNYSTKFSTFISSHAHGHFMNYVTRERKDKIETKYGFVKGIKKDKDDAEEINYIETVASDTDMEDYIQRKIDAGNKLREIEEFDLSDKERNLVILLSKETPTKTIAKILNTTEVNVRKRTQLLRSKLRKELNI
ncbi:MAG: sigma-70 family RNA polymerase sigma factor [Caldisericia bacterium]|nr:sigma-70 family RNA polymerase sigma factor [Caldisericia bacterium]